MTDAELLAEYSASQGEQGRVLSPPADARSGGQGPPLPTDARKLVDTCCLFSTAMHVVQLTLFRFKDGVCAPPLSQVKSL